MRTASFFYVRNELPVSTWVLLYINFKQSLKLTCEEELYSEQEQTCNISHVVLWGWKYIVEPRFLTHLLLLLALWCCLSFKCPPATTSASKGAAPASPSTTPSTFSSLGHILFHIVYRPSGILSTHISGNSQKCWPQFVFHLRYLMLDPLM